MGYHQGESVIDYTYCEDDVFNSAKSNIRRFIHIIIGLALGLGILIVLLSTLLGTISCLGGCLGCEACIESAACADEMVEGCDGCDDCSYEERTKENIQKADDCVSCDGIDCFGRTGCFACGGCGECDDCSGKKYYYFNVVVNGSVKHVQLEENERYAQFSSSDYQEFLGLYDKTSGGTKYIDRDGYIVKGPKEGMTLYPRYEEYDLGTNYTFYLDLDAFGMADETLSLTVGGPLMGLPTAPEKEGYTFQGWYLNGYKVASGNETAGTEFHLYDFGITPFTSDRQYTLTPKYAPVECIVTFTVEGTEYTVQASYNDTFEEAFELFNEQYSNVAQNMGDSFFGWGYTVDAEPEEKVTGDVVIKSAVTVHAIIREAIWLDFHYNVPNSYYNPIQIKVREKQTNVVFSNYEELEVIKGEDVYPGYEFVGWFTTAESYADEQPSTGIPSVDDGVHRTYYAHWEKAEYTLEYRVMDYLTGYDHVAFTAKYTMSDEPMELIDISQITPNVGYDCAGWSFDGADRGTAITQLSAGTYGNKVLHARFVPHEYSVTLDAGPNATFDDPNAKNMTVNYGDTYTCAKPTKEGNEFQCWAYKPIGEERVYYCTDSEGKSLSAFTLGSLGLPVTEAQEEALNRQVTLIAIWKVKTFDVIFMSEGIKHDQIKVEWKKLVDLNLITEPTKEGHSFAGWTYDGKTLFDATTKQIETDLTLYAYFTINTFTVKFMIETSEGGTPQEYPVNWVKWNTPLSEAAAKIHNYPNDNALHRKLVGWYADASCQTKLRDDAKLTEARTVYAKYDYADDFTFHGAKDGDTVWYYNGDTVTFPDGAAKVGYEFMGWCTDMECLTTPIKENVAIYEGMASEYYAKYEAKVYTITYQYEDGQFYDSDTYTIEDVKSLLTAEFAPSKTGYTFVGWREKNANGVLTGGILTELNNTFGEKTLVAQYTPNSYNLTLLKEGDNAVKSVTFDQAFDLGKPVDKEGYDFKGWSWTEDGSELVTDENGKSLSGVKYTYAYDTDIYPIYRYKTYTISWRDAETGDLLLETTAEHFSKLSAVSCSKDGYTFENWYKDKDCTELYVFDTYEVTGEETIYAKFTPIDYEVSFIIGTGLEHNVILPFGSSLADAMAAANVKVDDYVEQYNVRFVHWDQDTVVYDEEDTVPVGGLTLRAKFYWPITVQFYEGNTMIHEYAEKYYFRDEIPAYTYEKAGYEFKGWYTDGSFSRQVEFPIEAPDSGFANTYSYFAKWEANEYKITYRIEGIDNIDAITEEQYYTMDQTEVYGGYSLWTPSETEATKGYIFDGWYLSSDCTGEKLSVIDNSEVGAEELLYENITLYAKWTRAQYTLTLMKDNSVYQTITVEFGQPLENLPILENVTGKQFYGWKLQGTDIKVANERGEWESGYTTYIWAENIVLEVNWWHDYQ